MGGTRGRRWVTVAGIIGLFAIGIVFGLIMQNVWLGILLAVIVSIGWVIGVESRRGHNAGVNDEDHGIEV